MKLSSCAIEQDTQFAPGRLSFVTRDNLSNQVLIVQVQWFTAQCSSYFAFPPDRKVIDINV